MTFAPLPPDWETTRAVLHAHAAIAGAVARAHVPAHPRWWHVSLTVTDGGLATDPIPLPDGTTVSVIVDPSGHRLRLRGSDADLASFSLSSRPSEVADGVFAALESLGLATDYDRSRLHDDPTGPYVEAHAAVFWDAMQTVAGALEERRALRPGDTSPVQVWPHGFDIAFEWYGTKIVDHEENGEIEAMPAQLNLGWYPAGDAYFYSNPWPFDPDLTSIDLPGPAVWHTHGWNGTMLRYSDVAGDEAGVSRFESYADTVFQAVRPTLEA